MFFSVLPSTLCFRWYWLVDACDVNQHDRDVKAAPLPTVESAEVEQTEDSDVEDKDKDEAGIKDKKKRVGFRDRKVVESSESVNKQP